MYYRSSGCLPMKDLRQTNTILTEEIIVETNRWTLEGLHSDIIVYFIITVLSQTIDISQPAWYPIIWFTLMEELRGACWVVLGLY